jgi:glutamate formiminotransferase
MRTVVECVPNFSEGRDAAKIDAIVAALMAGPDVYLLDREMDPDHNRSVITLAGTRESIGEAAIRGVGRAAELIDLNRHQGAHPRIGATDVVPFVPIKAVTLDDCAQIARRVAEEIWRRFHIPTYLYEAAAQVPERRNLENIRRGQFEGLRDQVRTSLDRRPDFGDAELHPSAGATAVGSRKFLIAYNINLNTNDLAVAKTIASKIRTSSGGLQCVKAMGVMLRERGLAQVSMNLTDFETTSVSAVFETVSREAAAAGASVLGSEIVGLIPRRALEQSAIDYLKVENFRHGLIVENRLEEVLASREAGGGPGSPASRLAEQLLDAVAAPTPTPGGGSVAALTGAFASALGEMVCGVTLKRKSFSEHHSKAEAARAELAGLRARLIGNFDRDAASYDSLLRALRLPKSTPSEAEVRDREVEIATQFAASVPLETAELAATARRLLESLRPVIIPQARSDLEVALLLTDSAFRGSAENVRTNLSSIDDSDFVERAIRKLEALETPPPSGTL